MCTLTWRHDEGGYQLAFNRDESRRRSIALAPTRIGQAIMPKDPDGGGTWIAVNQRGICFALLNAYVFAADTGDVPLMPLTSRGTVIPLLLQCETPEEVTRSLLALCGPQYAPFRLCVIAPDQALGIWCWSGGRLWSEPAMAPVVSSGVNSVETTRLRTQWFQAFTGSDLAALHRSHWPSKGAQSFCMHRPEARTVSLSRISVDPERVVFDYQAGSPCHKRGWETTQMDRLIRNPGLNRNPDLNQETHSPCIEEK